MYIYIYTYNIIFGEKNHSCPSGLNTCSRFWPSCLESLDVFLPKTSNCLDFQSIDIESSRWRLFKKRVVHTKLYFYCLFVLCLDLIWFDFIVFIATFSNISTISWRLVLVVEEAGVLGENHRPWATNW